MIWQTGWLCPLPDQEPEAQPLFLIPKTPESAPPAQEYMAVEVFLMQGHMGGFSLSLVSVVEGRKKKPRVGWASEMCPSRPCPPWAL